MTWILENWLGVVEAVGLIVAAATAVAKLTPTDKDDKVVAKIAEFVGVLNIAGGFKMPFSKAKK